MYPESGVYPKMYPKCIVYDTNVSYTIQTYRMYFLRRHLEDTCVSRVSRMYRILHCIVCMEQDTWQYLLRYFTIQLLQRILRVSYVLSGRIHMYRTCIAHVSWAKSVIRPRYIRIHTIHMYRLKIHVSRRGYSKIPLDTSIDTYPSKILHNTRKIHQ